jgi:poly(A) polymerase
MSLAAFKQLLAHPRFDDLLALHEACSRAFNQQAECVVVARQRRDSIAPGDVAPPPLVTGEDLIAAGLQPGPAFKRLLDTLYDAQLNKELADREQALQRMQELILST